MMNTLLALGCTIQAKGDLIGYTDAVDGNHRAELGPASITLTIYWGTWSVTSKSLDLPKLLTLQKSTK